MVDGMRRGGAVGLQRWAEWQLDATGRNWESEVLFLAAVACWCQLMGNTSLTKFDAVLPNKSFKKPADYLRIFTSPNPKTET